MPVTSMVIKLATGKEIQLSEDEARELYSTLDVFFGKTLQIPISPLEPAGNPWHPLILPDGTAWPYTHPLITCSPGILDSVFFITTRSSEEAADDIPMNDMANMEDMGDKADTQAEGEL